MSKNTRKNKKSRVYIKKNKKSRVYKKKIDNCSKNSTYEINRFKKLIRALDTQTNNEKK